jgi:hypothetical protein
MTSEDTGETVVALVRAEFSDFWRVMRQDDHGNIFIVADSLSEEAAKDLVHQYEVKGHKQMYWAERSAQS